MRSVVLSALLRVALILAASVIASPAVALPVTASSVTVPPTAGSPGGVSPAAAPSVTASPVASDSPGPGERPEVPPPPFTEGIFPCSACHAGMDVIRTRRTLTEFHTDIELRHDEQHRWCLDCHDPTERDSLHLASGERIPFDESYLLCGQCHGEKLRDWRAGVHGRRTGEWNGHKQYLLCAHCHNPHQPRFRPLAPKPPPTPPARPRRGQ